MPIVYPYRQFFFEGLKLAPAYFTYVVGGSRYFTDDLSEVENTPNVEEFTALYASHTFEVEGRFFTFIGGSPSSVSVHAAGSDQYLIRTPKKGYFAFTIL